MKRLVLIGVGALGSHLALFARNLDLHLVVVDFDRVEQKNVASQFHTTLGVGRNKAKALAQGLSGLFGRRVEAVPHRLGPDNVFALFAKADLVVDCVDDAATRRLIQRAALELEIPCLHGALAADGSYGRVEWSGSDRTFAVDAGGEGEATCEDGEHLPFIARVAATMAASLASFLADGSKPGAHLRPDGFEPL